MSELAEELGGRSIRVNSINPGGVDTELGKEMVARTPLGRFGQPEDIGPVAVFLASANSGWLTGEILQASGGFR